jgi:hypothetical protein
VNIGQQCQSLPWAIVRWPEPGLRRLSCESAFGR